MPLHKRRPLRLAITEASTASARSVSPCHSPASNNSLARFRFRVTHANSLGVLASWSCWSPLSELTNDNTTAIAREA